MFRFIRFTAYLCFTLFLVATFSTPSWRYGVFAWWPILELADVAGAPLKLGLLNLLPVFLSITWGISQLSTFNTSHFTFHLSRFFTPLSLTLPFLLLTVWAALRLDITFPRLVFIHGGGILLAWLIYFYVVWERPFLLLPLSLIILIQSLVALGQFFKQEGLGLVAYGELPLNPAWLGITVLYARNTRWLRAYGLTAHPNLLGAILAMMLLLLLPTYLQTRGPQRLALGSIFAVGFLGLFVTFSRAAWLAFGVGTAVWLVLNRESDSPQRTQRAPRREKIIKLLLPAVPAFLLFLGYYDLVFSRFVTLDTPTEVRSLEQREVDSSIAMQLIAQNLWLGVGLGNYQDAADKLTGVTGSFKVHNVPLLVMAELGLVGLVLWVWLMAVPFWHAWKEKRKAKSEGENTFTLSPLHLNTLFLWAAMLLINQFDTMVWLSSNWQTAVLFALIVAYQTNLYQQKS